MNTYYDSDCHDDDEVQNKYNDVPSTQRKSVQSHSNESGESRADNYSTFFRSLFFCSFNCDRQVGYRSLPRRKRHSNRRKGNIFRCS